MVIVGFYSNELNFGERSVVLDAKRLSAQDDAGRISLIFDVEESSPVKIIENNAVSNENQQISDLDFIRTVITRASELVTGDIVGHVYEDFDGFTLVISNGEYDWSSIVPEW